MISKQFIKILDFETIEDIYNYTYETYLNGQFGQLKELINRMSLKQWLEMMKYFRNLGFSENNIQEAFFKWRVL